MSNVSGYRHHKFYQKMRKRADGTTVIDDMVDIYAPGMANRSLTPHRINDIRAIRDGDDPDHPAVQMARDRWAAIEPYYDAWKQGRDVTVDGTPLDAWSGVFPEQAEALKIAGIRSVEELATASDSIINKVNMPGVRELQRVATMFCENKDRTAVTEQLAARDRELEEMKAQLEELRQIAVAKLEEDDGEPKRRGPGRPPKVRDDTEVAA